MLLLAAAVALPHPLSSDEPASLTAGDPANTDLRQAVPPRAAYKHCAGDSTDYQEEEHGDHHVHTPCPPFPPDTPPPPPRPPWSPTPPGYPGPASDATSGHEATDMLLDVTAERWSEMYYELLGYVETEINGMIHGSFRVPIDDEDAGYMHGTPGCGDNSSTFTPKQIVSGLQRVTGAGDELYTLNITGCVSNAPTINGCVYDHEYTVSEHPDNTEFSITVEIRKTSVIGMSDKFFSDIEPRDFFPQCVQDAWAFRDEMAEQELLAEDTRPANPEEQVLADRANEDKVSWGHEVSAEQKQQYKKSHANRRKRSDRRLRDKLARHAGLPKTGAPRPARQLPSRAKPAHLAGPRKELKASASLPPASCAECANDYTDYGAACCDAAWLSHDITCTTLETHYNWDCTGCACPGDEHVEASLPSSYNPFWGSDCLPQMHARRQDCSDGAAFASTAALSLNFCLARARKGVSTVQTPIFSAQDVVSCGSDVVDPRSGAPYDCSAAECKANWDGKGHPKIPASILDSGASHYNIVQFIIDHGVSTSGCVPYEQGSCSEAPKCPTECVEEYNRTMTKVNGWGAPDALRQGSSVPMIFRTEENVAGAIKRFGAVVCAFEVFETFKEFRRGGLTSRAATGHVYMGSKYTEADDYDDLYLGSSHTVACYGWGTLSDGTKYWQCLNSWGDASASGMMGARGEFRILREKGEMVQDERGLLGNCVAFGVNMTDAFPTTVGHDDWVGEPACEDWDAGVSGWEVHGICGGDGQDACTCHKLATDKNGLCGYSTTYDKHTVHVMRQFCAASCGCRDVEHISDFAPTKHDLTEQPPGPDPTLPECNFTEDAELLAVEWSGPNGAHCGGAMSSRDSVLEDDMAGGHECTCERLANWGVCEDTSCAGQYIRTELCPATCRVCSPLHPARGVDSCTVPDNDQWFHEWGADEDLKPLAEKDNADYCADNPDGCCGPGKGDGHKCTCDILAEFGYCTHSATEPIMKEHCPGACGDCEKMTHASSDCYEERNVKAGIAQWVYDDGSANRDGPNFCNPTAKLHVLDANTCSCHQLAGIGACYAPWAASFNNASRHPNSDFFLGGSLINYMREHCPESCSYDGSCWSPKHPFNHDECAYAGGSKFNYCPETDVHYCCGVCPKSKNVACPSNPDLGECACDEPVTNHAEGTGFNATLKHECSAGLSAKRLFLGRDRAEAGERVGVAVGNGTIRPGRDGRGRNGERRRSVLGKYVRS